MTDLTGPERTMLENMDDEEVIRWVKYRPNAQLTDLEKFLVNNLEDTNDYYEKTGRHHPG